MNIIKKLFLPILLLMINFICVIFFSFFHYNDQLKEKGINYINSDAYKNNLSNYLDQKSIFIILITFIIIMPILIYFFKKENKDVIKTKKIDFNRIIVDLFIFIMINNTIYLLFIKPVRVNFLINLITTCIIGPIIEELIYRGIIFKQLLKEYDYKKAILITTLLFSVFHFNIVQMITSFIIGYYMCFIYYKYNNIILNIFIHFIYNLISLIIINLYFEYTIIIIPIILIFLIIYKKIIKNEYIYK